MSFQVSRTEEYSTNLAEQLWTNRNSCTDFVIKVKDQSIPCHKLMLLANSPVLKSTILSDMKEANSGEVHLDEFPYDVVMCVLEYMYTGSTNFSTDQLLDAVSISHYLEMLELHKLCVDHAPQTLSPANVVQWLLLATLQNLKQVVMHARQLIAKSFNKVSLEPQFLVLSLAELRDVMNIGKKEKAKSDDMIESVFRWINHDKDERMRDLEVLLQTISFKDCSSTTMREIQDKYSAIIDSNPAYFKLYCQAMVTTQFLPKSAQALSIIVLGRQQEVRLLDMKNRFSDISLFPTKEYHGLAACMTPLGLLVTGGEYDSDTYSNKVFLFLPSSGQWKQLQTLMKKTCSHACVYYAGFAYVLGGGTLSWMDNVEKLRLDSEELETEKWQKAPNIPTSPSFPKASVLCGLIYLLGNRRSDLYVFDPKTDVWGKRAKFPISPGDGYSMAAGREHLYVAGGDNNLCAVYSPFMDAWKLMTNKPKCNHLHGAMVMRGHTLVILGGDSDDVEQFDTEKEVWSTLDVKMPNELQYHQAVVMEI